MHTQLVGLWAAVALLTLLFLAFVADVYRQSPDDALSRIMTHSRIESLESRVSELELHTYQEDK